MKEGGGGVLSHTCTALTLIPLLLPSRGLSEGRLSVLCKLSFSLQRAENWPIYDLLGSVCMGHCL